MVMTDPRRARVESLFQQAADLPPEDRDAFLDEQCGEDEELRAEVGSLLDHASAAPPDFMEAPGFRGLVENFERMAERQESTQVVGTQFGRYRVVRHLGSGAMGAVFEAEQDHPRRRVALKVLRFGSAMPGLVRRFRREANLLARLQHPNIAHVYEAGVAELPAGPQPYFAMEYVEGCHLDAWGRTQKPGLEARVALMALVCDAVHHAHECGIVHRDLKPANILVDAGGSPKVVDFGVAHATDVGVHTITLQTEVGQLVGTIPYMSPEQLSGTPGAAGAHADIFSLGVILFELLSQRLPLDVRGRSLPEAVRLICDQEPTSLGTIDTVFRGDLDTIVSKAMEKDPERRYASAAELAWDLRRFLDHKPIVARPATTWYQLRKFARRNRGLVGVVVLAVLLLSAATVVATHLALREAHQRRLAVREQKRAEGATYRARLTAAQMAIQTKDYINARRILDEVDPAFRDSWEWRHLFASLDNSTAVLGGHHARITSLDMTNEADLLVSADASGAVNLWDLTTLRLVSRLGTPGSAVLRIWFAPGDKRIVSCAADGTVRVWRRDTLEQISELSLGGNHIASADLSEDGTRLITSSSDRLRVWELESGRMLQELSLSPSNSRRIVRFLGDREVVQGLQSGISRKPLSEGRPKLSHRSELDFVPSAMEVSADDRLVLTGCRDKGVVLWDADTMQPVRKILDHTGPVGAVAFGEQDRWFASAADDLSIRLWDTESGESIDTLIGPAHPATALAIARDGSLLVAGESDGTIRLWRSPLAAGSRARRVYTAHSNYVYDAAFDPSARDGSRVLSASWDRTVRLWNPVTGETLRVFDTSPPRPMCLAISPDGRLLAVGAGNKHIQIFDLHSGERLRRLKGRRGNTYGIAFSPDGAILAATAGFEYRKPSRCSTSVWDVATGTELAHHLTDGMPQVATSPRGLFLLTNHAEQGQLVDALTGEKMCDIGAHAADFRNLSFCTDGSRFLTAMKDGTIRVWDTESGAALATLTGHTSIVYDATFSPDDSRIVSAANDNTIRIWEARSYEPLLELRGHESYVHALAFSPDGARLVSASGDHTLRVWDTGPPPDATSSD
jgi:WD40 repeat protein/predicted Ser/Thr protein kinase